MPYESEENKEFVLSNQIVMSDEWIFPGENIGFVGEIIWFQTKTKTCDEYGKFL